MPRLPQNLNRPEIHSPTGDLVSSNFNMAGLRQGPGIDTSGLKRGLNAYASFRQKQDNVEYNADISNGNAELNRRFNDLDRQNKLATDKDGIKFNTDNFMSNLNNFIHESDDSGNPNLRSTRAKNYFTRRLAGIKARAGEMGDKRLNKMNDDNTKAKHDGAIAHGVETYDLYSIAQNIEEQVDAGAMTPAEGENRKKLEFNKADKHQFNVMLTEDPKAVARALHDDQIKMDNYNDAKKQWHGRNDHKVTGRGKPSTKDGDKSSDNKDQSTDESTDNSGAITNAGNPGDEELAKLEQQGRNNGNATNVGNPMDAELAKQMEDARKGVKPSTDKSKSLVKSGESAESADKTGIADPTSNANYNDEMIEDEPKKPELTFPHIDDVERAQMIDRAETVNKNNQVADRKRIQKQNNEVQFNNNEQIYQVLDLANAGESFSKEYDDAMQSVLSYDPSTIEGKSFRRKQINTLKKIKAGRIADVKKKSSKQVTETLARLSMEYDNGERSRADTLELASKLRGVSWADRATFNRRIQKNEPIGVPDYVKPRMQGYYDRIEIAVYGKTTVVDPNTGNPIKPSSYSPENAALKKRQGQIEWQLKTFIKDTKPTFDEIEARLKQLVAGTQAESEKLDWARTRGSKLK